VAELAEGYPLFAEQLVAWVDEAGSELETADMPPTIEALLASRLDRLDPGERAVLERASVVGRDFWRGAVASLMPPRELAAVGRHLLALVRKGLVRAAASELPAEDALRFHHVLVRDVAYSGIPKALRAELHERCADWLDANAGEPDEVVGYHLEQAYAYRRELGEAGRITTRVGADAGERLGRAGVRALARGDAPAAVSLLARATGVLPPAAPRRVELLCELGVAQRLGDVGRAEETLARAVEEAVAARDLRLELRARLERTTVRLVSHGDRPQQLYELTDRGLPVFEALNDDRSLGRLWFLSAWARGSFDCNNAAWEEGTERALVHYQRAGWPTSTCLNSLASALFFGPRPAGEAIARLDELLADESTDLVGRAHATVWRAALVAFQGGFDEARAAAADARRTFEELVHPITAATTCGFVGGQIEMLAGDYAAAEAILRDSAELLAERGERAHVANRAAELADALWALGRFDDALERTEVAMSASDEHDISAQFTWRSVRAKVLAELARLEEAEGLARHALELVDRTDALNQRANVRFALAHVLLRRGRATEAADVAAEAARLYECKGNVVSAARAHGMLEALQWPETRSAPRVAEPPCPRVRQCD
jgi:tetratricopeptide (TPR) repeat protein